MRMPKGLIVNEKNNLKIILFFILLTTTLTIVVILTWEKVLLKPFYAWVDNRYPGVENAERRRKIQQRTEHFFISVTVDSIVVTLLLGVVRRQQRRLSESEERYRLLFEHANDGIGVVSVPDFKLVQVNHKFGEILGYEPQELAGKRVRELAAQNADGTKSEELARWIDETLARSTQGQAPELDIRKLYQCPIRGMLAELYARLAAFVISSAPESNEQELTIQTPAGITVPVSASFSTLSTGRERLVILIIRDLSERKRLEQEKEEMQRQLFQSSKLASIGELSAGVAHEINNPLNGLINFAQLLKDEETPRTEFEERLIGGIIDEGGRIAKIVRNLLTFARRDSHELSPVNIAETINSSTSLFGHQLEKDGIRVEIEIDKDLPPVKADGSRLRQVVVNMISNAHHALKAKPEGEKVFRITARAIERDGRHVVRIEFYDSGAGIKPADQDKIFDPFFTTRRDHGGTGLGLSLSFGIIRDYGGTIAVESAEGSFTRFTVELPAVSSWEKEYAESLVGG
ncbi:MAG: PAS domain S-box protein [Acidobacteria bacterium]|nr:PAS domain S-box protein [Acidobacteriota bacterium]